MQAPAVGTLTPAEVEARLPLLVRIASDVVETFRARRELQNRRRSAGRGAESPESAAPSAPSGELAVRDEERRLTQVLVALETEIEQIGGTLADPETGMIEFPALVGGRRVLLSWRPGDDRVSHYRELDSSSEDRRPLPATGAPAPGRATLPPPERKGETG